MHGRAADESILQMLDLKHNDGLKVKALMQATGMTRGAICGAAWRVANEHAPSDCVKPENMDGGLPRFWWKS